MNPQIGKDQLGAACGGRALPDGGDVRHQGVDFRVGEVLGRGGEQPGIERQLAPVRGDGEGIILPGLDLPRADRLVARDEGLLDRTLLLGHRAGDDRRLVASEAGARQVQHRGGLHVRVAAEHLLQFRQVGKLRKAAAGPQAGAVRGQFHGVHHLAKGRGPGVKMGEAAGLQARGIEEALHRIHFHHRIADGGAGGEGHAMAGVLLVQVLGFHVQVEGAFAAPGLDAGHPFHLGGRLQVLEICDSRQ